MRTVSSTLHSPLPLRVAGAQDIVARSGIERIIRRIALPGNGPGLAVRHLRGGDVIVVVDQGVPFPQPPRPFENLVVFPGAARLAQPFVQVSKIGFEAFTLLRQNGLILLLTGLAPDAQLRLVLISTLYKKRSCSGPKNSVYGDLHQSLLNGKMFSPNFPTSCHALGRTTTLS